LQSKSKAKSPDSGKTAVADCVVSLKSLFPNVPTDFEWNGQTFEERCEAWALHAVEKLENELECYVRDRDDTTMEVLPQEDEDDD
jgi:hypothetical protein